MIPEGFINADIKQLDRLATKVGSNLPNGRLLIAASDWVKREGSPRMRVVIAYRDEHNDYVTWTEYQHVLIRADKPPEEPYTAQGHYDMTIVEAVKDFSRRCKDLGCKETAILDLPNRLTE